MYTSSGHLYLGNINTRNFRLLSFCRYRVHKYVILTSGFKYKYWLQKNINNKETKLKNLVGNEPQTLSAFKRY